MALDGAIKQYTWIDESMYRYGIRDIPKPTPYNFRHLTKTGIQIDNLKKIFNQNIQKIFLFIT